MARGDGIDRTSVRNMRLSATKISNTQKHNEREKDSYVNQDIVPERTALNVHFKRPTGSYTEMFEKMEREKLISTRGLKDDAFKYGELVFDVNSAYFQNHGGYEFAKKFYADAYQAAINIVGGEQYILSAVMHADERNRAMSEALGEDVYHYHLHVVYIPVVEKQVLWTKRCKDKSLVGTVKETVMQVSMSKKWASHPAMNGETGKPLLTKNGKPVLRKSYSILQDDFYQHMIGAGYTGIERGEYGSSEEHLTVTQFKTQQEKERLSQLEMAASKAEKKAARAQEKLDKLAPQITGVEQVAAKYINDPEQAFPQPGPLESAKSYREKKAKPAINRIIAHLRSLYRKQVDTQSTCDRLVKKNTDLSRTNSQQAERIGRLTAQVNRQRDDSINLSRLIRALGLERAKELLKEQILLERTAKQQRRFDR